jgi:tetratricopeptide (TPR) repeat protein
MEVFENNRQASQNKMTLLAQEELLPDEEIFVPASLNLAEQLRQIRKLDEAMRIVNKYLDDHYENIPAICLAAHIMMDAERIGMAQALMKLATLLQPNSSVLWSNLGLCYRESADWDEGEKCFIKALQRDPNNTMALNNLTQLYVNTGQPIKALNCANKALSIDDNQPDTKYNKGLALLQLGQWKEGWQYFDSNLGDIRSRKERTYAQIPRWTGVKGLNLIAYGEQGLGDEIFFGSCIPDLMRKNNVVIECDKRLEGLFKRSFGCPVYGTRFQAGVNWLHRHEIDASVAFGSLPQYFRNSDEEFPGTPFLKADQQRRIQWRALLDSLGPKKKVGIAWSGGIKKTGATMRSVSLDEMLPILKQDATFISLQYKDCPEIEKFEKEHGIKIYHWPHAMQTKDYDDTAALVAELDLVISVTQAVIHLAGGLGVPCWILTPKTPMWRYGLNGEKMVWYNSVKLYRKKSEWVYVMADVAKDLRDFVK